MCSANGSHQILEFKEFYLIQPSIIFTENKFNYKKMLNEVGKKFQKILNILLRIILRF